MGDEDNNFYKFLFSFPIYAVISLLVNKLFHVQLTEEIFQWFGKCLWLVIGILAVISLLVGFVYFLTRNRKKKLELLFRLCEVDIFGIVFYIELLVVSFSISLLGDQISELSEKKELIMPTWCSLGINGLIMGGFLLLMCVIFGLFAYWLEDKYFLLGCFIFMGRVICCSGLYFGARYFFSDSVSLVKESQWCFYFYLLMESFCFFVLIVLLYEEKWRVDNFNKTKNDAS